MLDCSETARQSKHCGCTALCSCVWSLFTMETLKGNSHKVNPLPFQLSHLPPNWVSFAPYCSNLYSIIIHVKLWNLVKQWSDIKVWSNLQFFLETWRFWKILEFKNRFALEFHLFVKKGFGLNMWVGIWATSFPSTDYNFKSWCRIPKRK